MRCPTIIPGLIGLAGALAVASAGEAVAAGGAPNYHQTQQISLPGDDGWDYSAYDRSTHQLFVTHGTRVHAVDGKTLAATGAVAQLQGVHGVAFAPELKRGYISDGRADSVVVFDLKTLAKVATIKTTGSNPDAILYEPVSKRLFTFNGRGKNITA